MCGIVGMIGRTPVADRLLDSLKRLEYRGYDSAGIGTIEEGKLVRVRAEGKLKNLEQRLAQQRALNGTIGIGHTRWATHGRPTEANAHPHATDSAAVVHNGIIENFCDLRQELEKAASPSKVRPIPKSSSTCLLASCILAGLPSKPSESCCKDCVGLSRLVFCSGTN